MNLYFKRLLIVLLCLCLAGCTGKDCESAYDLEMTDAVVGLLPDGKEGSCLVVYDTDTWASAKFLELPDVTPDNYAAISRDGKYVAYTSWDEFYVRRYLNVYETETGKTRTYFTDIPFQTEIIKISWMPDCHTLIYIRNDTETSSYQEIQTLDILNGETTTLVKGEVWKTRVPDEMDCDPEGFYLKGAQKYVPLLPENPAGISNSDNTWRYFLTQADINQIYQYYGGTGNFDIDLVPGYLYVNFSAPRCAQDGSKIVYSASLKRNSAHGLQTPLWMISSIWEYDLKTGDHRIIHTQMDGGCIGRTEWLGADRLAFVSYYEYSGSKSNINYLDLNTYDSKTVFPHSEEHYNNVTLLPLNNHEISFMVILFSQLR